MIDNKVKIIRVVWSYDTTEYTGFISTPTFKDELVYVWGEQNERILKEKGYKTYLVTEDIFYEESKAYGKKLVALDLALKEFGEVILLDWDCLIDKPLDDQFYEYLKKKPIQCPIYAQYKNVKQGLYEPIIIKDKNLKYFEPYAQIIEDGFNKYNWKFNDGLVSPNFSFVYSRDKLLGEKLINLAIEHNIIGCIEEHAMWLYANCYLEGYITKYHPKFVQGISDDRINPYYKVGKAQKQINDYVEERLKGIDIYFKHI
jgi:hypothetical protein